VKKTGLNGNEGKILCEFNVIKELKESFFVVSFIYTKVIQKKMDHQKKYYYLKNYDYATTLNAQMQIMQKTKQSFGQKKL